MPLLKVLKAFPVFRINLFLFLPHSDGTVLFLFIFSGFLFSFSVIKSVLCDSLSAETLISAMKNSCYQKCVNKARSALKTFSCSDGIHCFIRQCTGNFSVGATEKLHPVAA